MVDFFLFHILLNGYYACKSMETGQVEGDKNLNT